MKVTRPCKCQNIFFYFFFISSNFRIGEKLWIAPGDDLAVSQLANLWRSTLSRKGCFTLMRSGTSFISLIQQKLIFSSIFFQVLMVFFNR